MDADAVVKVNYRSQWRRAAPRRRCVLICQGLVEEETGDTELTLPTLTLQSHTAGPLTDRINKPYSIDKLVES